MLMKSRVVQGSLIYLLSSVIASSLPFLLLPVLAAYIPPATFGHIGIFQGLYTFFLALCGFSATGVVVRQAYDLNQREIAVFIYNVALLLAGSALAYAIILVFLEARLLAWLNVPASYAFYALLAATMFLMMQLLLGQYQVEERPLRYGSIQIAYSALNIGLSLLLVVGLEWGASGRVMGMTMACLIAGGLSLILLRKENRLTFRVQTAYLKEALAFGIPLIPHALGTFFISWFGIFYLSGATAAENAGLYLFAFQISMAFGVTFDAIQRAYVPWLYRHLGKGTDMHGLIRKSVSRYLLGIALLCGTGALVMPWLLERFVSNDYAGAASLLGLLILGQGFVGGYLVMVGFVFYAKKTGWISLVTSAGSAVNVLLLVLFVPRYGAEGAAISFLLTRIVTFLLTWLAATRSSGMRWFGRMT